MATFAGDDNVEPRYMKRRVKAGIIEADFELRALIVHYEVEATVLGDRGEAMQVEKKSHTKRIRLKQLNENTNVPLLAEEIVEQCKLIHHSKLPLVQEVVMRLFVKNYRRPMISPSSRPNRHTKVGWQSIL